ncbi:hypothetical protein ACLSU7_13095 [Bdellovibrio sp. HCB185ZH]|uniref:hypothetical protein n=1 Tax=Bdellovibrio sp. HCB185ZH TaxID=3394235 RepID=UPI0039A4758A
MSTNEKSNEQLLILQSLLKTTPDLITLRTVGEATWFVLKMERDLLYADILQKDLKPSWNSTKDLATGAKNFGGKVASYFTNIKGKAESNGIDAAVSTLTSDIAQAARHTKNSLQETLEETPQALKQIRSNIIGFSDQIVLDYQKIETDEEKGAYLLKLALYASILGISFYGGNELPDMDFKLWGPGAHRSFLSHSAIPFLTIKVTATLLLRVLERSDERLKDKPEALGLSKEIQQCLNLLVFGIGAGITTHLLIDGLIQTGGTIRLHNIFEGTSSGSLIAGTKIDDMAYTTLMGLFAGYETKKVAVAQG